MTDTGGQTPPDAVYVSKRDAWIVALLWVGVIMMIVAAVSVLQTDDHPALRIGMPILLIAAAGFVIWILYFKRYTLTSDNLVIRSGPFRWRVPLASIEGVVPTHNPLSSPACSLDRLRIGFTGSRFGVMISPQDKVGFLNDLASRTRGLKREGFSLVRDRHD